MTDSEKLKCFEKLKNARTVLRTSITKLINKIENLLSDPSCIDKDEIDDNIVLLSEKEKNLHEVNEKIFNDIPDTEDLEKELSSVEYYTDNILLCKNKVNRFLKKTEQIYNVSQSGLVGDNNEHSFPVNSQNNPGKSNIKLPRLTIETFDGDICKFNNFWSRFKNAIHDNSYLTDIEKFSYLKSYLTGEAEKSISGLSVINENYLKAINILESRFGRKELIIDRHMSRLLNLTPCRNSKDIRSLRMVYDTCEIETNCLKSLGIEPDSYGTLLFPILIKALPTDIILLYNRTHESDKNKISDLLGFLKKEIESRERTYSLTERENENINKCSTKPNENKNKIYFHERNKNKEMRQLSAAALNTVTEKFCIFCEKYGNHVTDDCDSFNLDEKKEILKRHGRCFACFKKFHVKQTCRSKIECEKCHSKNHRKGLCNKTVSSNDNSKKISSNDISNSKTVVTSVVPVLKNETSGKTVLMLTFKAFIFDNNEKMLVRCLLDSGSERTFVREEVSRKLKLPCIGRETVNLHTFGNTNSLKIVRSKVRFNLCNIENENKCVSLEALESPEICGTFIQAPSREINQRIQTLDVNLSDCEGIEKIPEKIDILIGSDFFCNIVTGNSKRLSSSVMLVETLMGWAIQGPVSQIPMNNDSISVNVLNALVSREFDDRLTSDVLKSFWELEAIGIENGSLKETISDKEIYENFKSTLKFKENKYEVHLPWKETKVNLNDNYFNAKKRLISLVRRFQKDPNLYSDYKAVIEEYKELNIIEPVNDQCDNNEIHIYYLPHHPVVRKDKETTKLRIVFDASSHPPNSPSLNDLLHPGPNLNPDLLNLLLKFRFNYVAFTSDIEKAFLMISLAENDRDVVRFLWIDKLTDDASEIEPKVFRLKRVLFGVSSSPFLLAGVIKSHLDQYFVSYPETCKMLYESMYVDDLLSGASSENEAFKRSEEAKFIMQKAGMSLRKWKSNSSILEDLWNNSKFDLGPRDNNPEDQTVSLKVLGLIWDRRRDVFKFDVNNLIEFIDNSDITKRTLIRSAGRIFDPTGFLSPFTVKLKMLFQELWERGIHWDEELPSDIAQEWKIWCEELPLINSLEIPRYYFETTLIENLKSIQVHCFTDASEKAYGAVIYIRYVDENDVISVSFLVSKSRVTPIKKLTIPRLELTAALIGARLNSHIQPIFKDLHIEVSYHFWTDSNIALCWIKNSSSKWKPYIANRVREIQNLTHPDSWHHCPGNMNPADIITRKKKMSEMINCKLWWIGPDWLHDNENNWPKSTQIVPDMESLNLESRKNEVILLTSVKEEIFDLKRFEKLSRVIRVTAWIKRFINNLKMKSRNTDPLNSTEILEAEHFWISYVQELAFGPEKQALLMGKDLPNCSRIKQFDPFLDDRNIIRVGGRLQNADVTEEERHPILLPYDTELSVLLIKDCHTKIAHCGLTATLTQLRSNYYIIKARKLVKSVINKCLVCKRYRAKNFIEKTAPLPTDRVHMCAAFEVTGIDFAGPLYIKENNSTKKSYICLFTCATIRAVHLEIVSDLRTETFILAFKRFIGRRGLCKTIYSDNAATFKKADKELQLWLENNKTKFQDYFGSQKIEWKYIVPLAAWWGGFWERMVRSVKTCLKKILGRALLTYEEMTTVVVEVEAILNSRPLTYNYDDFSEPTPLTPAHFLVGRRLTSLPTRRCIPGKEDLRKRIKYQQDLIDHFWMRWKKHYLLELRSNHTVSPSKGACVKLNDIVLIAGGPREPRQLWQLGKVTDVFVGRDGRPRACSIKTAQGTVRRAVQLVYNLEIT